MGSAERPDVQSSFKKKILMVDDSRVSLTTLEKILSTDLFRTFKASTGSEGLKKALAELPDLILLDVMMPEMNGFEVARKLKEDPRTHNIPIIFVTALDDPDNRLAGRETGAEEYLTKPVRPQELLARVNSLITLKEYRDQLSIRENSERALVIKEEPVGLPEEPPAEPPVVLLVEDNESDSRMVRHFLKDLPLQINSVASGKEAVKVAQSGGADLMLLDILLPDVDGFEVCRQVKNSERGRDIPLVVITCLDDMESKVKCLELNVDDFLVKPIVPRELRARVKILLEKKKRLDKLRSQYDAALNSAVVDWLTGLYNHGFFKKFLDLEIKKSLRHKYPITLIMIDIDDFKRYNDSFGHPVGDKILQELAQVLRKTVREVDLVARYGGDEFAVVLPYSDSQGALRVAQRIDQAIKSPGFSAKVPTAQKELTVSMGVAWYPADAVHADELIHSADQRLYGAKLKGKNQIAACC